MATYTSKEIQSSGPSNDGSGTNVLYRLQITPTFSTTANTVSLKVVLQARRKNSGYATYDHTGNGTFSIRYRKTSSNAWISKTYNWKNIAKITSTSWTTLYTISNYGTYNCDASGYFIGQFDFISNSTVNNLLVKSNGAMISFAQKAGSYTFVIQNQLAAGTISDNVSYYDKSDSDGNNFKYVIKIKCGVSIKNPQYSINGGTWTTFSGSQKGTSAQDTLKFGTNSGSHVLGKDYTVKVRAYNSVTDKVTNTLTYTIDANRCTIKKVDTRGYIYVTSLTSARAQFTLNSIGSWSISKLGDKTWDSILSGDTKKGLSITKDINNLNENSTTDFKIEVTKELNGLKSTLDNIFVNTNPDFTIGKIQENRTYSTFSISSISVIKNICYQITESEEADPDGWVESAQPGTNIVNKDTKFGTNLKQGKTYNFFVKAELLIGNNDTKTIQKYAPFHIYGGVNIYSGTSWGNYGVYLYVNDAKTNISTWKLVDPYVKTSGGNKLSKC